MILKKNNIPVKVMLSYLALTLLVVVFGWLLYNQSLIFDKTESKITEEKGKILKVSSLFSNIYKTESLARKTIQSNDSADFKNYYLQKNNLNLEIDSIKVMLSSNYQIKLLDSVKSLLNTKSKNIEQLKIIKKKQTAANEVKTAIKNISEMEVSLGKLRIQDFASAPEKMGAYQRRVLNKYIAYLNQNIPNDSTNTLSKKSGDSLLLASKKLLNKVKSETTQRNLETNLEESELLQNDIAISDQLSKILNILEREIIFNTTQKNIFKENSLKKTNKIVTISAIIGFILTVLFSILIIKDFAKTEKYKSELELANTKTQSLLKNREQLIATVSHDLKTPLSTIIGYTELLDNSELNKKQSYFIKNIKGSSEYISKLVQDLLEFTQIEAGKITIENSEFLLNDLIYEVAHGIAGIFKQKNIKLLINIDENLERQIISDLNRLKQVLSNLIGNSYKFTEKGFIKIDAFVNNNKEIIITIQDSGIGIEEDKQQIIFEEFTQADNTIEKKYGGTGLGLTISKKIIEILDGKLTMTSEFGKGSKFTISLPLYYSKQQENTTLSKSYTAVIIDDDLSLLNLTSEILKANNFNVFSYSSSEIALQDLNNLSFDFVITDIQMPYIDGFLFLEYFKTLENYKNQPVFALTGRTDLDIEIYKTAGFAKVFTKPYSPKLLVDKIKMFLQNKQQNDISLHENDHENNAVKNYALEILKEFLPKEKHELKEFLLIVKITTEQNIKSLKQSLNKKNLIEIQNIAHKMNPIFKQINALEISEILNDLEIKQLSFDEINTKADLLEKKINSLFNEIST